MRPIDVAVPIEKYGDQHTEEGTEEEFIGTVKSIMDSIPTIQQEKCEDTISRTDAINFLCDWICAPGIRCVSSCKCIEGIKNLPSYGEGRKMPLKGVTKHDY